MSNNKIIERVSTEDEWREVTSSIFAKPDKAAVENQMKKLYKRQIRKAPFVSKYYFDDLRYNTKFRHCKHTFAELQTNKNLYDIVATRALRYFWDKELSKNPNLDERTFLKRKIPSYCGLTNVGHIVSSFQIDRA